MKLRDKIQDCLKKAKVFFQIGSMYEKNLYSLKKKKSNYVLSNRFRRHAEPLIKFLLCEVEPDPVYIGILAGTLNNKGYGKQEIVNSVNKKIAEGIELRVILQYRPLMKEETEEPFVKYLEPEKFQRNIFIKNVLLNPVNKGKVDFRILRLEVNNFSKHILTASKYAFRFERDDAKAEASYAIDDEQEGTRVRKLFEYIWENFTEEFPTDTHNFVSPKNLKLHKSNKAANT